MSKSDEPAIDWDAFTDCVLATNWSRAIDLKREFGFAQITTMAIWHGKPVGLIPFLRVCRAMKIDPLSFLGNEMPRATTTERT